MTAKLIKLGKNRLTVILMSVSFAKCLITYKTILMKRNGKKPQGRMGAAIL